MQMKAILPAVFVAMCGPAMAEDWFSFQSPTGNIHCEFFSGLRETHVRCDMIELTQSYRKAPQGCGLDWGSSFVLGDRGKGELNCAGDTIINPGAPVLPYGQAVLVGRISCVSAKTGMTCTNAGGGGFSLSKAKQQLY